MSIYSQKASTLGGEPIELSRFAGKVTLFVNVASYCGYTPQYTGLQALHDKYAGQGFAVIGVPSNDFGEQEPGTAAEIAEFCSTNYHITSPLLEKTDVNGANEHPLYTELKKTADSEGHNGDIRWNFEKFLVSSDGTVIQRFPPQTDPEAPEVVKAIEETLG